MMPDSEEIDIKCNAVLANDDMATHRSGDLVIECAIRMLGTDCCSALRSVG